jgi:hypothetical protein
MFESLNSIAPHAKSGAVRRLAVNGDRPLSGRAGPSCRYRSTRRRGSMNF